MSTKFTNNASSKLTRALTADATSMHIQAEDVSKFPVLGAGDFCRLTIVGDHGDHEIVKVTSISSDGTCTIERAQESTTAEEWPIENKVELRITAEYLNSITTSEDVLSLVSPIEEDISNIKNNITGVENDILNIENKHASDIGAVNSSITAVQEDIENNISVSISNLEQSIADTSSSLENSINLAKEEAEASYVKKIGDTMTGSLNIKASHPIIAESSTSITKGTTPTENVTSQIKYTDKDGNLTGAVINTYLSEGSIKSALIAVDPSSDNISELAVKWKDGAACGYAPSPAIDAKSSEITTASWVNTKLSKYLPLTGGVITGTIIQNEGTSHPVLQNTNGGEIWLFDKNNELYKGGFIARARDEDTVYDLLGRNDGSLTWEGKNIVRSVGGATADLSGNVNAPYLPLTGGTITGNLGSNYNNKLTGSIRSDSDTYFLSAVTASGTSSSSVILRTERYTPNPNGLELYVGENFTGPIFQLYKNGNCTWNGKQIVRSVNGVGADANGDVHIPSIVTAYTLSGCIGGYGGPVTLPNYGTWAYVASTNYRAWGAGSSDGSSYGGFAAGGTTLNFDSRGTGYLIVRTA